MRPTILSLFVIAAALLGEIQAASAQSPTSYPWCARIYQKDGAATSCYFTSYQQCMMIPCRRRPPIWFVDGGHAPTRGRALRRR